jgi:aldose 1-epimerase
MKHEESTYGTGPDGRALKRYTLENSRGMRVSIISLGATITEVMAPDRGGAPANVVLGYPSLDGYLNNTNFFGCIVGRFANRIAAGRFTLDGREYTLARNDGPNHIHGGIRGFDKLNWAGELFEGKDAAGVRFAATSPDGDEGYPGALELTLEYVLTEKNELTLAYRARTDRATPINITNHTYWNLAGAGSGTVHAQELSFSCPFYLPVDEHLSPTGEVRATAGTPFDFSVPKPIGRDLARVPGGYDHCMVFAKPAGVLGWACTAHDPASGRVMEVLTTKPGVQLYTGNFLDGTLYPKHGAFCLETQFFPDSPNFGHFPSSILRPGETYHQMTVHRFSLKNRA